MLKVSWVSVVEDDRFCRESMRRLIRSLGYLVEAVPSAADFLASARLIETGCLVADVHMNRRRLRLPEGIRGRMLPNKRA
jgi:FixJ family two-component response regulator